MKLNHFNFKRFGERVLMTNDFGRYLFVSLDDFERVIGGRVLSESDLGIRLLETNMAYKGTDLEFSSDLRYDLRQAKGFLGTATSLHIFVVTTACNANCAYCQAKEESDNRSLIMSKEVAEKAAAIALQSPSRYLTFEFQGGEPLLNFEAVRAVVEYAETNKGNHEINYCIVTNLTLLTDEILDFLVDYRFGISTSVDGPAFIHDFNRPLRVGGGTHQSVVAAVGKIRKKGFRVGSIQTTTKASLGYPGEIVRSYRNLGFDSIFVRPLTPLGKAAKNWETVGYEPEEFVSFYRKIIDELLSVNKQGFYLKEDHASILMGRIMGRFVNYMELRSPCGAGIGQLAYYADGEVFTCDEGRMLCEMGDASFRLGNVSESSYSELVGSSVCRAVCASSVLESIPSCCDCVYQPYCGVCPVVNYAESGDLIEKGPRGYKCKIYSGILDCLFEKISGEDKEALSIMESWCN